MRTGILAGLLLGTGMAGVATAQTPPIDAATLQLARDALASAEVASKQRR